MNLRALLSSLVLAAAISGLSPGCSSQPTPEDGGTAAPCGPTSCAGCCQDDVCVAEPDAASCGIAGAACAACPDGNQCVAGACVDPSCDGCMQDGVCMPGDTNEACGNGGECAACTGGTSCEDRSCVAPPACDASSCNGCCDDTGTCRAGTAQSACGVGGSACLTCTGGSCTNGACVQPCGPGNCNGCCDAGGACVTATNAACGAGGAACTACAAGTDCKSGACVNTACAMSCDGCCVGNTCNPGNTKSVCGSDGDTCQACGNNLSCIDKSGPQGGLVDFRCHVTDLAKKWDIVVISATVPATNSAGNSWDAFGAPPDPFVLMSFCSRDLDNYQWGHGPVAPNTLTPNWGSAPVMTGLTAEYITSCGSHMRVLDHDVIGYYLDIFNDTISSCPFFETDEPFTGAVQQTVCEGSIVLWKLVPHI